MNDFSDFVESLKRLFINKKISEKTIRALLEKKKISKNEYDYVIEKTDTL